MSFLSLLCCEHRSPTSTVSTKSDSRDSRERKGLRSSSEFDGMDMDEIKKMIAEQEEARAKKIGKRNNAWQTKTAKSHELKRQQDDVLNKMVRDNQEALLEEKSFMVERRIKERIQEEEALKKMERANDAALEADVESQTLRRYKKEEEKRKVVEQMKLLQKERATLGQTKKYRSNQKRYDEQEDLRAELAYEKELRDKEATASVIKRAHRKEDNGGLDEKLKEEQVEMLQLQRAETQRRRHDKIEGARKFKEEAMAATKKKYDRRNLEICREQQILNYRKSMRSEQERIHIS